MVKILLVEDNELNRDMLSRRLSKRGYQVLQASDGAEGVDIARKAAPDLVLMDLSLPVMDGWQATEVLRNDQDTQNIPVIALTAHALEEDRQRATAAGCNDYATKPIDIDTLLGKINALVQKA
jgi:two-component system cell cycle response regulator DivK